MVICMSNMDDSLIARVWIRANEEGPDRADIPRIYVIDIVIISIRIQPRR